jgi:deazaflavin-dependent oxidoreductase (nitroreductase family)
MSDAKGGAKGGVMSGADFAGRKTVRLTTRGRKSGQARTVTIWFIANGPRSIRVQHVAAKPANWYRNLVATPAVTIDFGDGPIEARGTPITDPAGIAAVIAGVRKKYWMAWLIQWLGKTDAAVAAEITW